MLTEYIQNTLEKTHYRVLEDGTRLTGIPGFQWVCANANTVEKCRHELMEVFEEWLVLKISDRAEIQGGTIGLHNSN
jgi:predicted RNase H-like HicB family nuclease